MVVLLYGTRGQALGLGLGLAEATEEERAAEVMAVARAVEVMVAGMAVETGLPGQARRGAVRLSVPNAVARTRALDDM